MEFRPAYKQARIPFILLCGMTIAVLGLLTLTENDRLISYKAVFSVLTSLLWAVALLYFLTIFIRRFKRQRWRNKAVAATFCNDFSYYLFFDAEKISYSTSTYKTDLSWEYYKYWSEDKNSIYIFSESTYEGLYYSHRELGIENYERLKDIVALKLISLDK